MTLITCIAFILSFFVVVTNISKWNKDGMESNVECEKNKREGTREKREKQKHCLISSYLYC